MKEVIGYVRVSDKNRQDGSTQRNSISEYAIQEGIIINEWVTEEVSGSKTEINDRQLSQHLDSGKIIVMADITRLGRRSVMDLMGAIGRVVAKGGELHLAYTGRVVNESNKDDAETIFTIVGGSFAAVEESKKRSERAKAQHARQKKENKDANRRSGFGIGRRKGAVVKSKLDDYVPQIVEMLESGTEKTRIVEVLKSKHGVEVTRSYLYRFCKRKGLISPQCV